MYGWFDRGGGTSSRGGGDQHAPRIRIRPPPVDSAVDDGFGVVFPCEQSLGTDNHAVSWYVTNVHTHNDMHRCLMREGGMTLFHFLFGIEQLNGSGTGGTTTVSSRVIAVRAILCQM